MTCLKQLIAATVAASVAAMALSACNTVEGVGRDLKSAGKTIENAAEGATKDEKKK